MTMNGKGAGRGCPSVSVFMYVSISRYWIPMPPITTRLTITVQKVPFFVFFIP